ncbi:hypothetical protein FEP45_03641 [Burkholderia multivorans]|nr:hypothetical protein [Burkholderia multivorans]
MLPFQQIPDPRESPKRVVRARPSCPMGCARATGRGRRRRARQAYAGRRLAPSPSSDAPRRAACGRRRARTIRVVRARARAVHARHRRHPQGARRSAGARAVGGRQAARRVQAVEPRMGAARTDLAARGRCADRDRGSPVLPASWPRLATHRVGRTPHVLRRPAGRLDDHAAARAQPVSGRDRPRADAHAQAEGGDHRAEDRGRVQQGPDPRDLPEHGAVPLQRVRRRDGRAHLLRQVGRRTRRARQRDARRHAERQQLLQPGAEPGTRAAAAQYGARPDGEVRKADARAVRATAAPAAADRLRAAEGAAGAGAALCAAAAQMADRVGRPQRLQHLFGRADRPHDDRRAAAADGDAGADPADERTAAHREQRVERPRRLRDRQRSVPHFHARIARIQGRAGCRQGRRGRDEGARRGSRFHACAVQGEDRRAGRLRRDRSARRADPRVGRQPRLRERAVRPCRAGAAAAGLDVQGVRVRRCVRARHEARRYLRRPAGGDPAERRRGMAAERRRAADRQADDAARCACAVAQPDHGAGDGEGRPCGGRAARARHGRARESARARAVARARDEPRDAEGDGRLVRDDRERRAVRRAADGDADREP